LRRQVTDLSSAFEKLTLGSAVLDKVQSRLREQIDALNERETDLYEKARVLGYETSALQNFQNNLLASASPSRPPPAAAIFSLPRDIAGTDALRRRIDELQKQLDNLRAERARLTDEAGWLRRENGLLEQQRAALLNEVRTLGETARALEARNRTLQSTADQASAQNKALRDELARSEKQVADERTALEAQRVKTDGLQSSTLKKFEFVDGLEKKIQNLTQRIQEHLECVVPPVEKLTAAVGSGQPPPELAALLAVEAYRLSPFDPDDPAHPAVYNALWRAFDRLDSNAARGLIAPQTTASGKIGATASAQIVEQICRRVSRPLTQEEWRRYFPQNAQYTPEWAAPCRPPDK
jgi:hypothetical protein